MIKMYQLFRSFSNGPNYARDLLCKRSANYSGQPIQGSLKYTALISKRQYIDIFSHSRD